MALVSDAGTPAISDPGYVLVRACQDAGLPVEVLPGPTAAVAALVASGLPVERFRFVGFLPRKKGELRQELERGEETVVAFESPRRVGATLALLAEIDPERPVAVCRELTKLHEEVVRGSAAELARKFADGARGEVTLVIGRRRGGGPTRSDRGPRRGRDPGRVRLGTARGRPGRVLADRDPGQPPLPSLTKRPPQG